MAETMSIPFGDFDKNSSKRNDRSLARSLVRRLTATPPACVPTPLALGLNDQTYRFCQRDRSLCRTVFNFEAI